MKEQWLVYLYHFQNSDYGYQRGASFVTPKHYCGITNNLKQRDSTHKNGKGSRFIAAVHVDQGKKGNVVVTIPCANHSDARKLERILKNSKNLKYICPCCNKNYRSIINNYIGRYNIDVPY